MNPYELTAIRINGEKMNWEGYSENASAALDAAQAAAEELRKIGEYYYNLFLSGGQTAPEIAEFCQSAKSHYDEAAQAQAEIAGSVRKRKRPRLRRLLHKLRPRLTVRYAPRAARPLPRA